MTHAAAAALCPLTIIEPEGLNNMAQREYEEVSLAVDSGASETVLKRTTLEHMPATESEAQKKGIRYEVANGEVISNEGEKVFVGITEAGTLKGVRAQVCDVNRDLLSVSKVVDGNNAVVFHPKGAYIQDLDTQEVTWLKRDNGIYTLTL